MKKVILYFSCVLSLVLFTNCSTKYIKFKKPDNEIYPSSNLKNFLATNKNPKVVLRTPYTNFNVTESEKSSLSKNDYNYLYDAIEKELLKQGFVVRDRQLFNQVVSNKDNNVDYSKLKDKTDTDLIIELSKLDTELLYETNKYYTQKNDEKKLNYLYKRYGAVVEFKIILMNNNEFAGTYTYNYTPCSNEKPCEINSDFEKRWKKIQKGKEPDENVEKNQLEIFIRDATKQLVESMRK